MTTPTLEVSLWRGGAQGRYQSYQVPQRENQTVLDVVTFVQRHLDPTLSYRFACRVGMCGSCAMTVNGRPRWTCRTHVSKVAAGGRLTIGPLENLPVIKDLATDMQPFFEKWQQAKGAFAASQTRHDAIAPIRPDSARAHLPPTQRSNASIAASATRPATPCDGMLLSRPGGAQSRLVAHQRPAGWRQPRAAPGRRGSGGCHLCHSHQSCQEHCPQALNPTASIAGLKRRTSTPTSRARSG